MSEEADEANLAKLGAAHAPQQPIPEPGLSLAAPPLNPLPPDLEERIDLITRMFVEGKLSKAVYERNLARAYEVVDPRFAHLRQAHDEGRLATEEYDAKVRQLLTERR